MAKRIKVARGGCPCESTAPRLSESTQSETIRPSDFAPLFGNELGDVFLLVTSERIRQSLNVESDDSCELLEYSWTGPESRAGLVEKFRELQRANKRGTVVWIGEFEFEHYLDDELRGLKLGAISYFSGSFSVDSLSRCMRIIKQTDYVHELRLEEFLLDHLDRAERIIFSSPKYNTKAVFEHQEAEHWFSLHGPLDFGQQAVLPTGELSALTNGSGEYSFDSRFNMNGEILLKGLPVVHRGSSSLTFEKTEQTFNTLSGMYEHPVIAKVTQGLIEQVYSPVAGENPFLDAMDRLFEEDERYRKIHEIGFGTNVWCSPLTLSNFFPNERHPGVHFGLGLGGFTSFHHDLVCTDMDILFEHENGEIVNVHKELGLVK